ncbi:MAG: hypothetical protein EON58_02260 [Alphaproteobacteria bacterium]|nr:MAG: hypothetical protein EON58_02260 [Alphaproteobacteria bacterium]
MTLSDFASKLDTPKKKRVKGCDGFIAKCPAHEDSNPSFAVWESLDGWLHVNCQAGCTEEKILSALGLCQEDRRAAPVEMAAKRTPTFTYVDAEGKPVFEKQKFYKQDGKKTFVLRLPGAKKAGVVEQLPTWRHILYNLPAILKAIESGKEIWINEGEKACDALIARGLVATCQPAGADGGAPQTKWLDVHTQLLSGARKVVIVADRDEVGEAYAKYVGAQLAGAGASIRVVQSATTAAKDDAFDHFQAGHKTDDFLTREDLETITTRPPAVVTPRYRPPEDPNRPKIQKASDIQPLSVDWLFKPYFPKGMLSGIEGDPGVGKSMICAAIAAALSQGRQMPWSDTPGQVGRSVLIHTEDSASYVTVPRLLHFGANLDMVDVVDEAFALDDRGFKWLREMLHEARPLFVSMDPVTAFLDATKATAGRNPVDVHGVMKRLNDLAAELGCAFICLRHLKKSASGNPIMDGIGEISIIGKYRSAMQLRKDPDDRSPFPKVIAAHVKSNIGRKGKSFGYRIEPRDGSDGTKAEDEAFELYWLGHNDETADSLAERALSRKTVKGANRGEDAVAWLDRTLREGPIASNSLFEMAKSAGISRNALFDAKKERPGRYVSKPGKVRGEWEWHLVEIGWAPRPDQGGDEDDGYDPYTDYE